MVARSATTHRAGLKGGEPSIESVSTTTPKSHFSRVSTRQGIKSSGDDKKKKIDCQSPSSKSQKTANSKGTIKTQKTTKSKSSTKKSIKEEICDASKASSKASSPSNASTKTDLSNTNSPKASSKKSKASIDNSKPLKIKSSKAAPKSSSVKTPAENKSPEAPGTSKKSPMSKSTKKSKVPKSTTAAGNLLQSTKMSKSNKISASSADAPPTTSSNKSPRSSSQATKKGGNLASPRKSVKSGASKGRSSPMAQQQKNAETMDEVTDTESSDSHEDTLSMGKKSKSTAVPRSTRGSSRPPHPTPSKRRSTKETILPKLESAASSIIKRAASELVSKGGSKSRSRSRVNSRKPSRSSRRYERRGIYSYDDSTVTSWDTRPMPEITFSNAECNQMIDDTYHEISKYALQPLGVAIVRCACGPNENSDLISHKRSYSDPGYAGTKSPNVRLIHHLPECPSHQIDTTDTGGPTEEATEDHAEILPTEYAVNGRNAAVSAITMPSIDTRDGVLKLVVHDWDGEKPLLSKENEACKLDLDQLALQGLRDQYDEFVTHSKEQVVAIHHQLLEELHGMDMEKVKQKAESFGNTMSSLNMHSYGNAVSTLFHKANNPLPIEQKKAKNSNGNHVTIMTPSEEAQDAWDSGNVQIRISESQHHLTESNEPAMNPYARLDAVEVVATIPTKTSLPTVTEVPTEEPEEVQQAKQAAEAVGADVNVTSSSVASSELRDEADYVEQHTDEAENVEESGDLFLM